MNTLTVNTEIKQRWLIPLEAAKYTNMSDIWLRKMRRLGIGPCFSKLGGKKVLYDVADLDEWINSYKVITQNAEIKPDVLERILGELENEK